MAISATELSPENARICKGKIRALDVHFATNKSEFFGGDYDFIASMKDWIDKYQRRITPRQDWRVCQIWDHITDNVELSWEDFVDVNGDEPK